MPPSDVQRSARSFVGQGWVLHTGRRTPQTRHAHHSYQVSVGLAGAMTLRGAAAPGWIIAPDVSHLVLSTGPTISVYIEPRSSLESPLRERLGGAEVTPLTAHEQTQLQDIFAEPIDKASAGSMINRFLSVFGPPNVPAQGLDVRIGRVLKWLAVNPGKAVALAQLADLARLSQSRLSHLFREQTGMSIRTYQLWLRLQAAVRLMAEGSSATEAAHSVGFADGAHFARTCRRMFGVAPSELPAIDEVIS